MKKKRFGFLTASGTVAAAMTVFIVAAIGLFYGGILFNPGPLNAESGALLGGVNSHYALRNDCSSCHSPFWSKMSMADLCEACHTDILPQLASPTTLHGNLHQNNPALTCRDCHPEHRGKNSPLTDMGRVQINHNVFKYSLAAHVTKPDGSEFACADCHSRGYAQFDQGVCESCHRQIKADFMQSHLQAYGSSCLNCHDGIDTYGHAFSHSLEAFPLTGKHLNVDCYQCHAGARTIADMKALSQDCSSCHTKDDIHQGVLGNTCQTCHTTEAWVPSTFNHDTATFKLTGKHANVACKDCHSDLLFKNTASDCNSCHAKDDPHNGQLGVDCASCHTTAGWSPSTFDHNTASFKLTGKHVGLPCTSCHSDKVFKGTPSDCYACHARDDAHSGQLGTSCGSCHSTNGWIPSTFDHNSSSFKLIGKHATVPCASCHVNKVFKGTPTNCYACHSKDDAHIGKFGTSCGTCHSSNGWLPATFDHNIVFPLTGAHAGLACTSCHTSGGFSGLSTACSSCHGDPAFHAGLFSGTSCSSCHSTGAWVPASYSGPHPGGCEGNCINHQGAVCRDCHTTNLMTATCTKCHSNNNPGGGD